MAFLLCTFNYTRKKQRNKQIKKVIKFDLPNSIIGRAQRTYSGPSDRTHGLRPPASKADDSAADLVGANFDSSSSGQRM
jgi:hypothetical protein